MSFVQDFIKASKQFVTPDGYAWTESGLEKLDVETVDAEKADITGEAFVAAEKTTNQSLSAGTWATIDFDGYPFNVGE